MRLKNAVFLALIGAILLSILLLFGFVDNVLGMVRGIIAPVHFVASLIETFAGVTAAIFLYVFYRERS